MQTWGFEFHPIPGAFREFDFANVFGLWSHVWTLERVIAKLTRLIG